MLARKVIKAKILELRRAKSVLLEQEYRGINLYHLDNSMRRGITLGLSVTLRKNAYNTTSSQNL